MKNQFWAGLGSRVVLVKKKFGADYEQLLSEVFSCFNGQKIIIVKSLQKEQNSTNLLL
jgi:hypothetical protein